MEPATVAPAPPSWPAPPVDRAGVRAAAIGKTSATLVGLGAALLSARTVGLHLPACPFRTITGVPCPGCGMTRLADAVAHGHLGVAVRADAAGVAILVSLLILATIHVVNSRVRHRPMPLLLRTWLVPGFLFALVTAHWITTIVTGGLSPT